MKNMKKLIDLLNEFENTDNWENWNQVEFRENKIISKKFWFIQRLVKNQKIDLEKVPQVMEYSDYESLLMFLAIQDNPIDFLLSILK